MALEALAQDLVFALSFILIVGIVAQTGLQYLAQRNVANTIELGVQGILGIDSLREIDEATDNE